MKATRIAGLLLAVAALAFAGCGDDSDEDYYPQVLYRLEAIGGGGCFRMDHIASGGARHELDSARIFSLTNGERATFLLANAPPPYEARFEWVEAGCADTSGILDVRGFEVQGPAAEPQQLDAASPVATIRLRADVSTPVATEIERPRVRFEVCTPINPDAGCGGGPTGRGFTGNIGDAFTSHLLSQLETDDAATTPSIVFLENPRDRVSGIFRGLSDQLLRGELYVNDDLAEADNSTSDVVLSEDL